MKINSVTDRALARKVERELMDLKKAQVIEAEELFNKDKKFSEYHKICKAIEKLTEKRTALINKFSGTKITENIVLSPGYRDTNLYCESKAQRVYAEHIAEDILAKAAFADSDITLEDFIKELIEDYK